MPIHLGRAYNKGKMMSFYQYGTHGKKYFFHDARSMSMAYKNAVKQAQAIKISESRRK